MLRRDGHISVFHSRGSSWLCRLNRPLVLIQHRLQKDFESPSVILFSSELSVKSRWPFWLRAMGRMFLFMATCSRKREENPFFMFHHQNETLVTSFRFWNRGHSSAIYRRCKNDTSLLHGWEHTFGTEVTFILLVHLLHWRCYSIHFQTIFSLYL
jgi:hypothetical protein